MNDKAKKSLYRLRAVPRSMRAACAAYQHRLDEQAWQAIETEEAGWLEQVQSIAIMPMLSGATAKMVGGELRESLYGFARAFGYAADQRRRHPLACNLYRWLSAAFDRVWLRTQFALLVRHPVQEATA